jgi:hypothetical protein
VSQSVQETQAHPDSEERPIHDTEYATSESEVTTTEEPDMDGDDEEVGI